MQPIPLKDRKEIDRDPYYKKSCLSNRPGSFGDRIVMHHAWQYAGKQISELWNYCPLLDSEHSPYSETPSAHNSQKIKLKVMLIALQRADMDDLQRRMPKKNWQQEKTKIIYALKSL